MRRLLATEGIRLVVLAAPAGYGKTTLLRAWDASDPRPFRWLSPGRGPRGRARWRHELAALAAAPERLPSPSVLVVDGLAAGVDRGAGAHLAGIAEAAPAGTVVAVAARTSAVVPAGRLRAEHDVLELGARELAMTPGEGAALLDAHGLRLPPALAERLATVTEGWPALLSLAAQSLAGEPDRRRAVAGYGGDHPFVADYVRDELLVELAPGTRRFLRRCSVLDVLDPEACDALLGTSDATARLHAVEGSGLPVARVERGALRLRCHPLLRDVLRDELRRREPDLADELHRRASAWFDARDDADAAVGHALAAGDLERAGALLWHLAQSAAWDGRRAALEGWLARLPEREVARHDALALAAAMAQLSRLAVPAVDHRLTHVAGEPAARGPALRRSLLAGRLALAAATARDGVGALREPARQAAALAGEDEPVRALSALLEGAGAALAGDERLAVAALEDGVRRSAIAAPGIAALCQAELALLHLVGADFDEGATLAERARSRADAIGLDDRGALALVVAVAAFARAHRGRFAEARADVQLATSLLARAEELPPWYGAQVALALARAELRLSDVAAARRQLADAERAARRLPDAPALAAWLAEASAGARGPATSALPVSEALTVAELRVLGFLPSHLSFREIGACLHVSANTIKSQAHAVYRKLGASSRSVAVERARALGLLDAGGAASPGSDDAIGVLRS
ncbi:MAG TPA: LuxR C-terminal-related transcriptional regulator [Baekduia sp.]|nr:LuxR C-terminal-related transcriptional regulator [Baekduia sp.]